MSIDPKHNKQRMIQLDVLRGIAILMVLCNHLIVRSEQAGLFKWPTIWLTNIGPRGVDLFFVLSGFLVGGLLMSEIRLHGAVDIKRFLVRRAFKIWPSYYLYLAVMLVILAWQFGGNWGKSFWWIAPNIVHLQNYAFLHPAKYTTHTWSLGVEEHFYLALSFLLMFLAGSNARKMRWIPGIALGISLLCLCLRLLNYRYPFTIWTHSLPTHLRMDSLFAGVLLAYWYHFRPEVFAAIARQRMLPVLGILLVLPAAIFPDPTVYMWTFGYTLTYVGFACLLVTFVSARQGESALGKWLTSRSSRSLAFIGTFSYSIYIWHPDLLVHPLRRLCNAGWLSGLPTTVRFMGVNLAYIVAAIVAGIVLAKVIEYPSLLLRDRLFPARTDALGRERKAEASDRSNVEMAEAAYALPAET